MTYSDRDTYKWIFSLLKVHPVDAYYLHVTEAENGGKRLHFYFSCINSFTACGSFWVQTMTEIHRLKAELHETVMFGK